jgi:hypothetical protein
MSERQHTHHAHYAGSLARPFHNEQVIFKRALGQGPGPLRKGPLGPKNINVMFPTICNPNLNFSECVE